MDAIISHVRVFVCVLTVVCLTSQALLDERFSGEDGSLHLRTVWRDFESSIEDDSRYKQLVECSPDMPQTLFDDFCDALEDKLYDDRKILKKLIKDKEVNLLQCVYLDRFGDFSYVP